MNKRREWLATLSTRELVIYLMELRRARLEEPGLSNEVESACAELRIELLTREWPAAVGL
jgi:hypothetical protein